MSTLQRTEALFHVAVLLGAQDEWDSAADYLEAVADIVGRTGLPHPGEPESRQFYREHAEGLGIWHDGFE